MKQNGNHKLVEPTHRGIHVSLPRLSPGATDNHFIVLRVGSHEENCAMSPPDVQDETCCPAPLITAFVLVDRGCRVFSTFPFLYRLESTLTPPRVLAFEKSGKGVFSHHHA